MRNTTKKDSSINTTTKLMVKRNPFDSTEIMYRAGELMRAATNRYKITVQVSHRAKVLRSREHDQEDQMKDIIKAIVEMSDELNQPEIIGE